MRTRSKRLTSLVAVAAASMLAITACSGGNDSGEEKTSSAGFADCEKNPDTCNSGPVKKGGELIYALEQTFTNWNIASDEGNALVGSQALAGVVPGAFYTAPSGKIVMNEDLLVSAELTNQAPQTVVYKIQSGAVWSDGIPISSADFEFAKKQQSALPADCKGCIPASASGYEVIKSVVGSDNGKTVTVTFNDGATYPEWKVLFGQLYPAHIATKQGFDLTKPEGVFSAWEYFGKTVPTWSGGAYLIDKFETGQTIVQLPNPKWYGKVKPQLDRLVFKFVIEQASVIPALKNKEINVANPQPNQDLVTQAGQVPGLQYFIGHGYTWEHLDLNLQNKYLKDLELRKALFTVINVGNIVTKTYGAFDKASKPLLSHNFTPNDPNYKDVITATGQGSGDVEKAKKILTDAGYKFDASGGLLAKTGEKVPPMRFVHTKGNQLRATTGELVQADAKKIGIDVTINTTETLGKTLSQGDFDIMIFAWVASPFYLGGAEQNWVTAGGGNYGKYSNPEVDKLTKQAATTLDAKKAAELTNQADELLAKDAYVLPLVQKPTLLLAYSEYLNVRDNASNSGVNYNNHEWGLKAS